MYSAPMMSSRQLEAALEKRVARLDARRQELNEEEADSRARAERVAAKLAGAKKEWKPTLELAVAKFVDAKCRREEVSAALEQHVGAGEIEKEKYLKEFS